jgi:hypothetical protein
LLLFSNILPPAPPLLSSPDQFASNFAPIFSLLDRAAAGDAVARAALLSSSATLGSVTLLMIAAGSDRADVCARILAEIPVHERAAAAVDVRDVTGRSALVHAAALGRAAAVDALLRGVGASAAAGSRTFNRAPGGDAASLSDLGLSLETASAFQPSVQSVLRFFLQNPSRFSATPFVDETTASQLFAGQVMSSAIAAASARGAVALPVAPAATAAAAPAAGRGSYAAAAGGKPKGTPLSTSAPLVPSNVSTSAGAGLLRGRALEQYKFSDAAGGKAGGSLESSGSGGADAKFDQFAANAKLTGRTATFVAEAYTTPLNTGASAAAVAEAEAVARELKDESDDDVDVDEETRFSAVGGERGAKAGDAFTDAAVNSRGAGKKEPK